MELHEIIAKALNEQEKAEYTRLNEKFANMQAFTKQEQKDFAELRQKIMDEKSNLERTPLLEEFKAFVKRLQDDHGFKMAELLAAMKVDNSDALTIGVFKFSDYKFKATNQAGEELLNEDGTPTYTEFEWKLGDKLGPGWKAKFVAAIREAGIDKASKFFTEEFRTWLEQSRVGQGPSKGEQIFENKRAFYKTFGANVDGTKIGAPAAKKSVVKKVTTEKQAA